MKVPYRWLREFCAPDITIEELEQRLTISGTKVESIHAHGVGGEGAGFVVGKVLSCGKHPDADRLNVTTVDVGDGGEPQQIVCGAPNVAAGQTVAVARPGAIMPDGTKLKKAKLRGVTSHGMICSEDELGLAAERSGGIMVLDDNLVAGTPLAEVLPILDAVIEFEITPNRPDCLGVYGIAREVHAATGASLAAAPWADDLGTSGYVPGAHVRVEAPDLCPRFTARVFENVTIGESPRWLKARLLAAGMRPISNVVDITNYAMLLTGHPLHAFDLDKVAGGELTVRRAKDGERIETLDGQTRTLDRDMVVIEDAEGPTSIAGVMGGARSEVEDGTTRVLMEVASWIGPNIHRTSNKLQLRSEASGRFEKGLAPEQAAEAQAVATKLMIELTGATVAGGTIDAGPFAQDPWPSETIRLREAKVASLLGLVIPRARQKRTLTALGFSVEDAPDGLDVTVPPFRRNDVTREADLVEEVGRFDLDQLPATLPKRRGTAGRMSPEQRLRRRAVDALVGRGAYEIVGWSFTEPGVAERLRLPAGDPRRSFVALENPMSEDHSVLRTTVLGSLLDAVRHNVARGQADLALLESGAVYVARDGDPLPHEHRSLGAVVHGRLSAPSWGDDGKPRTTDFFAAKGLLAAVLDTLRVTWSVEAAPEPFLHPGRSARVLAGPDGEVVGWVGELHPLVARAWELDGTVAAFELDLDRVVAHAVAVPRYEDLTSFPPVRQDLAVIVADDVSADAVLGAVRGAGGKLLQGVRVFDVYRGAQVGEGRKSLALALTFQAPDRTLSDDDVAPVREKVVAALASKVGGELRG
ncbi:MAG TPA: phenylalanine--tRNA ligase subunit beta [Baekduia sp.]|uniref:phenylalanine--tRNA ligase subunit beta n=1 Tax=Baekduia sp. TaxID=2600305 RepID=UPI002D7A38D4|nr:phenylalanine--tRNA ligase subunit beta [Baekduia sp.]HET6505930.1 phenylalanine--tRNA ligase subunit beta [Baekduia sp.]